MPVASREKNRVRRMIVAKSAIEAAAMVSWPKALLTSPESLRRGTTTPSDVAERMIATIKPSSTCPAAERAAPIARAIANEIDEACPRQSQWTAAEPLEVDLQAGEEQQKGQSEEGEDADHGVELDPPEDGGADHDPGNDLEHDGGQP